MHESYMRQALGIARFAEGRTSPNPMVGAVIVKDGRIVGQGWHRKAGTPHAEVHALNQAGELAKGATIYVTLEPCAHYGRTPPCCEAVIGAGITRAVVAMTDPNPLVAGSGIKRLRQAGIEVTEGILQAEAMRLNEIFLKWVQTKLPFITVKTAMTLDGKIATYAGNSQWITGAAARQRVHQLRDCYDAILVGIGTALKDDPSLTTRMESGNGKNPVRIIVDSMARLPLTARVLSDQAAPTIIAVTANAPEEKLRAIREKGAQVLVAGEGERVDLRLLMETLGAQKYSSVFVEGGAGLNEALLRENLIDKVHVFISPKLIGGKDAPSPFGGKGVARLEDAFRLCDVETETLDGDILISGYREKEASDVYRNH